MHGAMASDMPSLSVTNVDLLPSSEPPRLGRSPKVPRSKDATPAAKTSASLLVDALGNLDNLDSDVGSARAEPSFSFFSAYVFSPLSVAHRRFRAFLSCSLSHSPNQRRRRRRCAPVDPSRFASRWSPRPEPPLETTGVRLSSHPETLWRRRRRRALALARMILKEPNL